MTALLLALVTLAQPASKASTPTEYFGTIKSVHGSRKEFVLATKTGDVLFRYDNKTGDAEKPKRDGKWIPPRIGTRIWVTAIEDKAPLRAISVKLFHYPIQTTDLRREEGRRVYTLPEPEDMPFLASYSQNGTPGQGQEQGQGEGQGKERRKFRSNSSVYDDGRVVYEIQVHNVPDHNDSHGVLVICDDTKKMAFTEVKRHSHWVCFYVHWSDIVTIANSSKVIIEMGKEKVELLPEGLVALRQLVDMTDKNRSEKSHDAERDLRSIGGAVYAGRMVDPTVLRRESDGDGAVCKTIVTMGVDGTGLYPLFHLDSKLEESTGRFKPADIAGITADGGVNILGTEFNHEIKTRDDKMHELMSFAISIDDYRLLLSQSEFTIRVGEYDGKVLADEIPALRCVLEKAEREYERLQDR